MDPGSVWFLGPPYFYSILGFQAPPARPETVCGTATSGCREHVVVPSQYHSLRSPHQGNRTRCSPAPVLDGVQINTDCPTHTFFALVTPPLPFIRPSAKTYMYQYPLTHNPKQQQPPNVIDPIRIKFIISPHSHKPLAKIDTTPTHLTRMRSRSRPVYVATKPVPVFSRFPGFRIFRVRFPTFS